MRLLMFALLMLFSFNVVWANEIDKLKTNDEVSVFLAKKANPRWQKIAFLSSVDDSVHFGRNRFLKMDINGDGRTDLIVEGAYLLAITDEGNNTYSTHIVSRGIFFSKFRIVDIIYRDKLPAFIVTNKPKNNAFAVVHPITDTIVFKFNGFVELNMKPASLKIEKIVYSTTGCYGTCPIFEVKIDANHNISYNAKDYNDIAGMFTSTLDGDTFNRIAATINYIKLTSLKDNYEANWTDDQTVNLEVIYNNGQSKKISDYGKIGSFGLVNLYEQLTMLRTTLNWHKDPYHIK